MSAWSSEGNATLGEVIAHLKTLPPEMVVERGWNDCYSYRGYYEDLAFHAAANVSGAFPTYHATLEGARAVGVQELPR